MSGQILYTDLGSKYNDFSGLAGFSFGPFISFAPQNGLTFGHPSKNKYYYLVTDEMMQRFTFISQLAFSQTSFREQSNDTRYTNYYLDLNLLLYFNVFEQVDELKLYVGFKPSMLLDYSSELFVNGGYNIAPNYLINKNQSGTLDYATSLGISLAFSKAINLELGYTLSLTDKNKPQNIERRPSTYDIGLRINANELIHQLSKKDDQLVKKIKEFQNANLFVMLQTPKKAEMERLEKNKDYETMDILLNELYNRNQKVIRAFREHYNFSKVYFFMDTSVAKVSSGKHSGVFVNDRMEADTSIQPDSGNYFISSVTEDISAYTTKFQFGLFVYDKQLIQLPKPFNSPSNLMGSAIEGDPFNYVRNRTMQYSTLPIGKAVARFNTRLLRTLYQY